MVWRRTRLFGARSIFARVQVPEDVPVLYLDMGTHKQGHKLHYVATDVLPKRCRNFEAFGFEANRASFEAVSEELGGMTRITLVHTAVCGTPPESGRLRLYHDDAGGLRDSIYRETSSFEMSRPSAFQTGYKGRAGHQRNISASCG